MVSMVESQIKMWQCADLWIGARRLPSGTKTMGDQTERRVEEPNRRPKDDEEEILLNNLNTKKHESKARECELEHKIYKEMRERKITHEPSAIKSSTSSLRNVESAFRV
jgi:hypothetical protein